MTTKLKLKLKKKPRRPRPWTERIITKGREHGHGAE
jgi:hypothetical protein